MNLFVYKFRQISSLQRTYFVFARPHWIRHYIATVQQGKLLVMAMFDKHSNFTHLAQIFQAEICLPDTLFQNGKRFLLAIYVWCPKI